MALDANEEEVENTYLEGLKTPTLDFFKVEINKDVNLQLFIFL